MTPIIEIQNLTKRYGRRAAVEGLNLTVEAGEIFGFVGPNGAGKTTTIRVMTTLAKANSGEVLIAGNSVRKAPRAVRRAVGFMPDFFGVYDDMKVWEYLDFFAACYKIPEAARKPLIADLLELVDLTHRRDDMVDKLSRGMKQRLSLARTLVHDPQVLVLDEPASGLDPRARVEIRQLMVQLAGMGKTIFFSTHILADVEEICTRVGIIEAGKMVAVGSLDTLRQMTIPHRKIEIGLLNIIRDAVTLPQQDNSITDNKTSTADRACQLLSGLPGVTGVQALPAQNGGPIRLELEFSAEDAQVSQLAAALVQAGFALIHFNAETRDLEAVFMQATKGLVT